MSNYSALKTAIQQAVYTNGNNEITGAGLQSVLLQIVNTIGDGYVFKGAATAGTAPGTPDENVFYIAPAGTYTNFGSDYTVKSGYIGVFMYNGSWSKAQVHAEGVLTNNMLGTNSCISYENAHFDKYIDENGAVQDYVQPVNKYYYTDPIFVKAGQGIFITWNDNGMGGMSFINKASSASDTGPYTPIAGMVRGDASNTKGARLYCVMENGYYVISFRRTDWNNDPLIADYGVLKILTDVKVNGIVGSDFYFAELPIVAPTFNAKGLITGCKVMLTTNTTSNPAFGYIGWVNGVGVSSPSRIHDMAIGELLVVNLINRTLTKKSGEEKLTEGDRIVAKLTNNGFIGECASFLNDGIFGYPYATRTFLDPSAMVLDAYITTNGAVDSYANYFYTTPVFLKAGTLIVMRSYASGLAAISKTDEGGTFYNPVLTLASGATTLKVYTYYVKEDGYFCISGWFTDKVMFMQDPIIGGLISGGVSGGSGIPSYYETYLENKSREINDTISAAGTGQDSFVFVTDTHLISNKMHSPAIASYLLRNTYIGKFVFGGDFVGTFHAADAATAKTALIKEMAMQLDFVEAGRDGDMRLAVHGNHDINDYQRYGVSAGDVRAVFLQKQTGTGIVVNSSAPDGCYYYYDNSVQGIRYIVFDACPVDDLSAYHATVYGVDAVQMDWIANAVLSAPQGYNFVFMTHVPVVQNASSDGTWQTFANVRTLCDAVKNKKSVTIGARSYDFSAVVGDLLMVVAGHAHGDLETFVNGVLHVTTATDAFYPSDSKFFSLWGNDNFTRSAGTTTEQILDSVVIAPEDNIITFVRIGAGYTRKFNVTPINVTAGSSVALSPSVSADAWYIADSTGLTYGSTNPAEYPVPTNNVATISNGMVHGLSAGEAIACASDDSNLIREFFYIEVQ